MNVSFQNVWFAVIVENKPEQCGVYRASKYRPENGVSSFSFRNETTDFIECKNEEEARKHVKHHILDVTYTPAMELIWSIHSSEFEAEHNRAKGLSAVTNFASEIFKLKENLRSIKLLRRRRVLELQESSFRATNKIG